MRQREIMNAHYRREAGVVVSFSTDHGDRLTVHRTARTVTEAVRLCIEAAERHEVDGPWFVEVISTPQTVYQDLIGDSRGDRGTLFRERQTLSRLRRLDMLRVPSLLEQRNQMNAKNPGRSWRTL